MKKLITTALISLAAAGGLAGCGSSTRSDSQVAKDLQNLFSDKGVIGRVVGCTHSSGNQYTCEVSRASVDQSTVYLPVTDDGKSIYEQGLTQ